MNKVKCPECNKEVIEIHTYKNPLDVRGDKLYVHKIMKGIIGNRIAGCYVKQTNKGDK